MNILCKSRISKLWMSFLSWSLGRSVPSMNIMDNVGLRQISKMVYYNPFHPASCEGDRNIQSCSEKEDV